MSTITTAPAPTKAKWQEYERGLAALDRIHDCNPDNWTVRLQSPGFAWPDYVGSSMWVCDECRPMVATIMTCCHGGYVVKQRGEK